MIRVSEVVRRASGTVTLRVEAGPWLRGIVRHESDIDCGPGPSHGEVLDAVWTLVLWSALQKPTIEERRAFVRDVELQFLTPAAAREERGPSSAGALSRGETVRDLSVDRAEVLDEQLDDEDTRWAREDLDR